VGVCQRDVSQHFPQLQGQQQQLAAAAAAAHQRCVGDTFAIPSCEWGRVLHTCWSMRLLVPGVHCWQAAIHGCAWQPEWTFRTCSNPAGHVARPVVLVGSWFCACCALVLVCFGPL
jgi:hypothetical protein